MIYLQTLMHSTVQLRVSLGNVCTKQYPLLTVVPFICWQDKPDRTCLPVPQSVSHYRRALYLHLAV